MPLGPLSLRLPWHERYEAMSAVLPRPIPTATWQRLLPLVLLLAAVLVMFRETALAMVTIWLRSDTFAHCILVPPISLWLAWRKRTALSGLVTRPMPWLLLPMALVCLLWLLGELAMVGPASQFALVTLVVLLVPALYGWAATRELLFPLAFLYFSVPLGEFLVPTLIDHTADFTVAALRLSGIPVYHEGNDFVIPSGNWSVVEACSGVRYLIASFMVGTLFAYLNYVSLKRRLAFMAVALVVPIVANWVRAYLIVLAGHLSGNTVAVGVDHLIYGWLFFGIVVGLMYMIGARWAEVPDSLTTQRASAVGGVALAGNPWPTALLVLALLVGTQAWLWRLEQPFDAPATYIAMPAGGIERRMPFEPGFRNPSIARSAEFQVDGRSVWLWIGQFHQQGDDRKLVSSANTIVSADDKGWAMVSLGRKRSALPAGELVVRTADLRQVLPLQGPEPQRLRAWQFYRVGEALTSSDARAKLLQSADQLLRRSDQGTVILIVTPSDAEADSRLQKFLHGRVVNLVQPSDQHRAAGS